MNDYPALPMLPWKIAVVAAIDVAGGFSRDDQIPWDFKEDFRWFSEVTRGNICVMGRATYDGIVRIREERGADVESTLLPGRECYVVTSSDLPYANATRISSLTMLPGMWNRENQEKTMMFIGGEQIFKAVIHQAHEAFITMLADDYSCDRFFPIDELSAFTALAQYNASTFDGMFFHLIRKY